MVTNIQILRALAAINVIFAHILGHALSYGQPTSFSQIWAGWGANGVDIFFVISGFLMLHTQLVRRKTPLAFFKSRIIRIAPTYWAMTLFIVALALIAPSLFRQMVVTPQWTMASLFFVSSLATGHYPIIHVGWTLEWEMFFYLVFAAGLFFTSWRWHIVFVVAILLIAASATQSWIVLEFLFGMLAALVVQRVELSPQRGLALVMLGATMLCLSLIPAIRDLGWNRVIIWGIPSFFLVLGAVYATPFRSAFLSYCGDASYSLYLVQTLSIPAFYKISSQFLAGWNGNIVALLCLASSVAAGCVMYALFEKPVTTWLQRQSRREALV